MESERLVITCIVIDTYSHPFLNAFAIASLISRANVISSLILTLTIILPIAIAVFLLCLSMQEVSRLTLMIKSS